MLKKDEKHEDFVSTVLCSKGIGSGYLKRADAKTNIFNGTKTKELYTTRTGLKFSHTMTSLKTSTQTLKKTTSTLSEQVRSYQKYKEA